MFALLSPLYRIVIVPVPFKSNSNAKLSFWTLCTLSNPMLDNKLLDCDLLILCSMTFAFQQSDISYISERYIFDYVTGKYEYIRSQRAFM